MRWRLQRLKARLLLDAGRHAAATAMIEHAVAGARRGGSRLDLAVMQLTAAQIAEAAGDRESARGHLAEAGPALDDLHVESSALRREAAALAARLRR